MTPLVLVFVHRNPVGAAPETSFGIGGTFPTAEHRLERNRLKGRVGNAINAWMRAAVMNFVKFFWWIGRFWLFLRTEGPVGRNFSQGMVSPARRG